MLLQAGMHNNLFPRQAPILHNYIQSSVAAPSRKRDCALQLGLQSSSSPGLTHGYGVPE